MQIGIYLGLLILLSLILFSSYLCCHHACRADKSIKDEFFFCFFNYDFGSFSFDRTGNYTSNASSSNLVTK